MKTGLWFLLVGLLFTGCATSTVETRRHERSGAYATLSQEQKAAVDAGQIKVGMPMDAVYIAWGKPSQILAGESPQGPTTLWLYVGTYMEEYRYWAYSGYGYCGRFYTGPYLAYDFNPRPYVKAEVRFEQGVVKEWRSLARPGY